MCPTLLHAEGDEVQLPRLRNVRRWSENQNLVCLQRWSSQQCSSRLGFRRGESGLEGGKVPPGMSQQQEKPTASWSELHIPRAGRSPWLWGRDTLRLPRGTGNREKHKNEKNYKF